MAMALRSRSLVKGFFAGALGGALGTLVLNFFQKGSLEATRRVERKVGNGQTYTKQQEELLKTFEDAHARTAEDVAAVVGAPLSRDQRAPAALVTEFAFGILCAGIYGALAESLPFVTAGFGTVYGAALFAGASEVVLPLIQFVPSPGERTPVQHAGGLAGNLVYGAVTEGTRRLLRG